MDFKPTLNMRVVTWNNLTGTVTGFPRKAKQMNKVIVQLDGVPGKRGRIMARFRYLRRV